MNNWIQITSDYFTAAISVKRTNGDPPIVVVTAPILNYMIGWTLKEVKEHCKLKGWKIYNGKK